MATEFQARWDEKTVRRLIDSYKKNPKSFTPAFTESLKNHANYHGVPFYEGEFSILDAIGDLGKGFVEGFTTLSLGEPSDNEYEAIFRSLGHLGGFAPGIIAAPLTAVGKVTQSASVLGAAALARKLNDKSIPMFAAKHATNFAKKHTGSFLKQGIQAKNSAVNTAANFMQGNRVARHLAEGAFHLGTASAVSAWQGGVDQMMSSFLHGGMAGGAFRAIGNYVGTGNTAGGKVAKSLAGSLFMGLPSTMQGATTPEQVYNYLLGAWFGSKEQPWTVKQSGEFTKKFIESAKDNPGLRVGMDPKEFQPAYDKLPPEVKPVVEESFNKMRGGKTAEELREAVWYFAEQNNVDIIKAAEKVTDLGTYEEIATAEGPQVRLKKGTLGTYKTFVLTTGQRGLESVVAKEAHKRKEDIANIHLMTPQQMKSATKKDFPGIHHKLSDAELSEANAALVRANETLNKKPATNPELLRLIRKNYFVAKNADALYVAGKFSERVNPKTKQKFVSKRKLTGAPGWAAQMAMDMKKPVYLYEINQNKWFKYHPSAKAFGPETPKTPPARLGFVSDPAAGAKAKNAFKEFFVKHFPEEVKPKEAKEAAQEEAIDNDTQHLGDTDAGSKPTEKSGVGKKAYRFLDKFMKEVPELKDLVPGVKESRELEIMQDINAILKDHTNPGETLNRHAEFMEKVQSKYNFRLPPETLAEASGEVRQWINRRNNDKPILNLSADGNPKSKFFGLSFIDPKTPISRAGTPKNERAPYKNIDLAGQLLTGTNEGRFHAILDHISVRTNKGWQDIDVNRYKQDIRYGENAFNKLLSRGLKHLAKEENGGFYYYGGQGTYDRMIMVKWHPKVDAIKTRDIMNSKYFKMHDIKQLKADFIKRFANNYGMNAKEAGAYFEKAFKSNVLWHLSVNNMRLNKTDMNKVLNKTKFDPYYGPGFIGSAKGWNKRSQIWFTDSYAAEKDYYRDYRDPETKQDLGLTQNGDFRFKVTPEMSLSELKNVESGKADNVKSKSTEMLESMDGGIIVRDDVIGALSLESGQPFSVGQNKSFILSPNYEHGAFLGKYMFHAAGPKQSEAMRKENVHFDIPVTAVKQLGTRKLDTPYDLDPSHIKFNYSVTQGPDMLKPQSIKKQIFGNLIDNIAFAKTTKDGVEMRDIVNDMFDTLIEPRYRGTDEANKELESYIEGMNTLSDKELIKKLDKLDFDKMGLSKVITAMHIPGNQLFARKAYEIMLSKRRDNLSDEYENGGLTRKEYLQEVAEIEDVNTVTQQMIVDARLAAKKSGKPENLTAIFTHPFVNAYRMKTLSSWVVNQATKPKVNNSGSARMRPYDKFLRVDADNVNHRLKKLNTDDSLFFLDNAYKDMMIETDFAGRKSLEYLWNLYTDKQTNTETKAQLKEVFRSVVARVPLDSLSGAQVLKFSGFTGRKGHGILLHSRVMKALGGADLDGDSAYFYMGGKGGFKKEWKDIYRANKEEFYEERNGETFFKDAKEKEIVDKLISDEKLGYDMGSGAAMFAPNSRMRISETASYGQGVLLGGAAVNPKQLMGSAYNMIVDKGSDTFDVKMYNKKTKKDEIYSVKITPKTSEAEKSYAKKLSRAMIGVSADAADYEGLKPFEQWWKMQWGAHFKTEFLTKNGKKITKAPKGLKPYHFNNSNGIYGMMAKSNSAYYGKDYVNNRSFTMDERHEMTRPLMEQDPKDINTMTPKIARLLHGLDYSDNSLSRLDYTKVQDLFNTYNETVKQYDFMKDILGRTTFKIPSSEFIASAAKYKLYDSMELDRVANNNADFRIATHGIARYQQPEMLDKFSFKTNPKKAYFERIKALRDIRDEASDYMMHDLTTLITTRRVKELLDKMSPDELRNVEAISRSVERLKNDSWLMARARRRFDADIRGAEKKDELSEIFEQLKNDPDFKDIEFIGGKKKEKSLGTTELDQAEIDRQIRKLKKGSFTTKNQKDLFDVLMLGSLRRGDLRAIDAFEKKAAKKGKLDQLTYQVISGLRREAAKTSLSRLGYGSTAVNRKNRVNFISDFSDTYTGVSEMRSSEAIRKEGISLVEEPQKQENVEKGMPEKFVNDIEDFLTPTTGWEGIKKPKEGYVERLDPETKSYIDDVTAHLKLHGNHVRRDFNFIVRDLLQKDINIMNKSDWAFMKEYFDDISRGTLWQRLKKQQFTKLSKRHYMQFPETINKELMKDEIILMQKQGVFLTAEGVEKTGKVLKPTQYMDILTKWIGEANDAAIAKGDALTNRLGEKQAFLDDIPDAKALHDVAVAVREHPLVYEIQNRTHKKAAVNWSDAESYNQLLKNVMKETDYENLIKNKTYTISETKVVDGKEVVERVRRTGEEVVKSINDNYTRFFEQMHNIVTGDVPKVAKGKDKGKPLSAIPESLHKGKYIKGFYDKAKNNPIIDHTKFVRDMKKLAEEGKPFPMEFGVDGIRKIARSMMIEMGKHKIKDKKVLEKMYNTETGTTGRINFENYWPHMHYNKRAALDALKKYTKNLRESDLPESEVSEILKNVTFRHHALTGDWNFNDIEDWKRYDEMMHSIAEGRMKKDESIDWFSANRKAGSMFSREGHLPGWSLERTVPGAYAKSIVNTYFRQMAQIFSRNTINDFSNTMYKKFGAEQTDAWTTFMKLYVQGAIGNPDIVPEEVLNDPKMSMRGTPYAWWADNRVKNRLNKIADSIGILKKDLPENLRGLDVNDIRKWSNLEAKFELASLLAHPKSVVNNIFGGTLHTIQSVGLNTWLTARSPKKLSSINPEWTSKQALDDFVVKHGVLPEYLMSEYGLAREYHSAKNKAFIEGVARKLRRDPDMKGESVVKMATESGVSQRLGQWAANFMSVPERALRRDAFMSHYLHWYKRLGGAIKDFDHPFLIQLAKKGVKATQFLYSAPYRPMFARTGLGKIMTRFQLWGWNAVRFRKEALKQARLYGFKGEAMERAARMMQLDLLVFGLGNMFTYSLFDTAMPAPWNWLQDTSEWIFGDEEERNRAFFGQWPRAVAPLQTVTPPILRLPMASIRGFIEDDWSKVSDYYIYTMFPFGRIWRDIFGPNNLIENPMGLVDKWTGVPLFELGKKSKALRNEE